MTGMCATTTKRCITCAYVEVFLPTPKLRGWLCTRTAFPGPGAAGLGLGCAFWEREPGADDEPPPEVDPWTTAMSRNDAPPRWGVASATATDTRSAR